MAYVSKELKAKAVANLKTALKDVKIKYSVSVQNSSTLVCTISQSEVDFLGNYNDTIVSKNRLSSCGRPLEPRADYLDVNEYWLVSHFTGEALEVLEKIKAALLTDEFYNNTDIQSDHFDRSHYISIRVGKWDKPFVVLGA